MDHQLAATRSEAELIQRSSCDGPPKALVNVQHGSIEVKRGSEFLGPEVANETPSIASKQAQILFLFILLFNLFNLFY